MKLALARRLRVDPEQLMAHCGEHMLALNRQGLIDASKDGYYFRQTRFLSRFGLSSQGRAVKPVSCVNVEPHATVAYYLSPTPAGREAAPPGDGDPTGGEIVAKGIEIQINNFVGGGLHQDVFVANHGLVAADVALDFDFAADFADLAEVGSGERRQSAPVSRRFASISPGEGELTLAYDHPRLDHATCINVAGEGELTGEANALRVVLHLGPQQSKRISIDVAPVFLGDRFSPWFGADGEPTEHFAARSRRLKWLKDASDLEASNARVQSAWSRAATDLYALQQLEGDGDEILTPIAGVPKYSGLFGRDSLVAGIQSLGLNRSTLNGALHAVGAWTAKEVDDRYDAEPGKVLHQRELGPLALLGETPFKHYYGDYSAPAYYLIGAATHFAQSANRRAFEDIRVKVEATLAWMDRYGDIDGDGFYEYRTRAKDGLKNQGWKDSGQAILYPDGSYVRDPIAVAEVQGLFYAAKQTIACLFAEFGESERAAELFNEAARLKQRFNERFWMPDLGFIALALDPEKKQVRTIASNAGVCLASGIVDDDKTHAVVDRLMQPDMFSGWGIRTLSSEHPAFNPLSYHLGSVWPVSNAHACVGFKRYGFNDAFHRLAEAAFDATSLFDFDRLPEVFGGHERAPRWPHPGLYPDACSPQAWSASAIVQICHMMTGVMTLAPLKTLVIDPALPDWLPQVVLRNLWIGDERASIILRRTANGDTDYEIAEGAEGWRIVRLEPGRPGRDRFAMALEQARRLSSAS